MAAKGPSSSQADLLARRVLVDRLGLKAGENVTIEAYTSALPWATAFVREARRRGARPLLHYEDEGAYWDAVEGGKAELIGTPGQHEFAALAATDVYVYFWGPEDQARGARLSDATWSKLTAFNRDWYDAARKAGLRGARMGIARVTEPNAKFWGVPVATWRREVLAASTRDPATLRGDAARLAQRLAKGTRVRLRNGNGTDLTLALAGRDPVTGLGEVTAETQKTRFGMMQSVPDANVYVAVDEGTAEGTLVSNRVNSALGEPLRGGRFEFSGGRLKGFGFSTGAATFRSAYRSGSEGKDRPSFLEVGLDPALRVSPGLEESERGAVTVGVGRNVAFGGKNESSFSGFVTVGGADLSIDDEPVLRRGRLV